MPWQCGGFLFEGEETMKWDYQLEPPDDPDENDEFDDQEPDDDFYTDDASADAAEDQWIKKRNL